MPRAGRSAWALPGGSGGAATGRSATSGRAHPVTNSRPSTTRPERPFADTWWISVRGQSCRHGHRPPGARDPGIATAPRPDPGRARQEGPRIAISRLARRAWSGVPDDASLARADRRGARSPDVAPPVVAGRGPRPSPRRGARRARRPGHRPAACPRLEVVPEATFNRYGERGSIDILAWHPGHTALLIVEVKSVMPDVQALLSGIDRKQRIAPGLAADRGWRASTISRLIVLPDDRTARRRVATHDATFAQAYPARTREIRHWIVAPVAPLAGILFLPAGPRTTARHRVSRAARSRSRRASASAAVGHAAR